MPEYDMALLDPFPDGVISAENGIIVYLNHAARMLLPELQLGQALPEVLQLPLSASSGTSSFSTGTTTLSFSTSRSGSTQLITLHPAPCSTLTQSQMDGVVRQLRDLLGEIMVELAPHSHADQKDFVGYDILKSYHRLFRLVDNTAFLNTDDDSLRFHPITVDLAGLCSHTCLAAGDLLEKAGVHLNFQCVLPSLLIPGDPALLQRMLLELISNAVKFSQDKDILLSLHCMGSKAILILSDRSQADNASMLATALVEPPFNGIPTPGQGAGLGLAVARHVAALHGGAILVDYNGPSPNLVVSLPARPGNQGVSLHTPSTCIDGGLHPLLVGLADVLPSDIFGLEGLD